MPLHLDTLALASGAASIAVLAVTVSAVTPEPPTDYQGLAVIITAITLASASLVSSALAVATFIVARKSAKEVIEVKELGIVTHDLVDGLAKKKDAAIERAARAEGKEVGVEQERANPQVPAPPTT